MYDHRFNFGFEESTSINPALRVHGAGAYKRFVINHPYLTFGRTFGIPKVRPNHYSKSEGNHPSI